MANSLLDVQGKVTGEKELSKLLAYAPQVYKGQLIYQLKKERDLFIGKRGSADSGVFKKKLRRKKIWGGRIGRYGGDKWGPQFVSLFRGKVTATRAKTIGDISLGMGHFYESHKSIHQAVEMLGKGGTISSSKEMIIPVYKNLYAIGIRPKTGMSGEYLKGYGSTTGRKIFRIGLGGVSKYFDENIAKTGDYGRALMFIGVHQIKIKKQYDFVRDWKRREPKAINRLGKAVDRATQKINRGKY